MIFFIPWVVLIVAVIIAVPVAAKMSPNPGYASVGSEEMGDEYVEGEVDEAVVADDFGEPMAEPLGDDAFEDFK